MAWENSWSIFHLPYMVNQDYKHYMDHGSYASSLKHTTPVVDVHQETLQRSKNPQLQENVAYQELENREPYVHVAECVFETQ